MPSDRLRVLKSIERQSPAFRGPGGERLRDWIDACPNSLYSVLTFQGSVAWRARLTQDIGVVDGESGRALPCLPD